MSGNIAMGGNNISGGGTATFSSFVGDLTGNADTATALETARTIQVSGDVAGSASFDGTADINISTTIQANSVALGTDTTGNYVATVSGTANEIEVSGSGSETAAVTIGLPDDVTVTGELTVSGTGQSSFGGQVTVPATPSASTDAASKGYVDSQVGANNELSEVLANGNTTGGTDISVSAGDDITFADSSKAIFGTDGDLEIFHNDSNAIIENSKGILSLGTASYFMLTSSATDNELSFTHTNGNWFVKATTSNSLVLGSGSLVEDYVTIKGGGVVQLNGYGSGSNTGTAAYNLSVDSSGNIIETAGGVVDGSGTANDVAMWSDSNTLTDAPIAISGNNATFAGNIITETTSGNKGIKVITANDAEGFLIFGDAQDNSMGGMAYNNATNSLDIDCNNAVALSFDSSQNATFAGSVGIGITSTPPSPLTVVGTGVGSSGTIGIQGANAHVGFKNSSGTFRSWVGHFNAAGHGSDADLNLKTGYGTTGNIRFSADGDTTAAQMFLQGSTGNVIIGTDSPVDNPNVIHKLFSKNNKC